MRVPFFAQIRDLIFLVFDGILRGLFVLLVSGVRDSGYGLRADESRCAIRIRLCLIRNREVREKETKKGLVIS